MKDKSVLDKYPNLKQLPFQVQINFTKLDGMKVCVCFVCVCVCVRDFR